MEIFQNTSKVIASEPPLAKRPVWYAHGSKMKIDYCCFSLSISFIHLKTQASWLNLPYADVSGGFIVLHSTCSSLKRSKKAPALLEAWAMSKTQAVSADYKRNSPQQIAVP